MIYEYKMPDVNRRMVYTT